jgi:hypothetical protein
MLLTWMMMRCKKPVTLPILPENWKEFLRAAR